MSMIQGMEITPSMFTTEDGICTMSNDAIKLLLIKFETKLHVKSKYLSYISKPVSFRKAIWHQADRLGRAIDINNADLYEPIMVR